MEQAFILPLPQSARLPNGEEEGNDSHKTPEVRFLQIAFEKLRMKKMKWEEFFKIVDPSDPSLKKTSTKEGNNILHLAVLSGLNQFPKELSEDPGLLGKRNVYGLTPFEVAKFLQKGTFLKQYPSLCPMPFHQYPALFPLDAAIGKELEKLLYLSHPVFASEEIFSMILERSKRAKSKDQIPPEKTWMGIYFDKEIQQAASVPVSIRHIDEEVGLGVFTEQRIPPCSFVGEYTGIIRERKRSSEDEKKYCIRYDAWETGRRCLIIDAGKMGNFTRFINHSADPNLSLQSVYWRGLPRMIFIALKEIEEGTQLTFDYGTFFWKECQQTPKSIT